jgi:hypothetical protein
MKYHLDGSLPPRTHYVWVFGSNDSGIHGAGSARVAYNIFNRPYGIQYSHGLYVSGNLQESYAIPTKDINIDTLPLSIVKYNISVFREFVEANPTKDYYITRIGCGLAGFDDRDIAPLFKGLGDNCSVAREWEKYIEG